MRRDVSAQVAAALVTLAATLFVALFAFAHGDTFRVIRTTFVGETYERLGIAFGAWVACVALFWSVPSFRGKRRWFKGLHVLLGLAAAGVSAVWLALSLRWGVRLDLPVVLYPAGVAARGLRVPFRDVIDMNQPGAYFLYGLLDRFAPSPLALRIVDVALVGFTGIASVWAFRLRPAKSVAAIALALFVWSHLFDAGVDCLQREIWILALVVTTGALVAKSRWLAAGLVAGLACWVKFHAILLVAPFVWLAVVNHVSPTRALRDLARFALGIGIVTAVVLVTLAWLGGLAGWWEIVTRYLPLYSQMTGTLVFHPNKEITWLRRAHNFFTQNPALPAIPLAFVLAVAVRRNTAMRSPAVLAAGLLVTSLTYLSISGTFWRYQSIPAYYAAAMLIAVSSRYLGSGALEGLSRLALTAVVVLAIFVTPLGVPQWDASGNNEEAVLMGEWLRTRLPAGETVQPLDTASGVLDAMRRAHAPIATSFIYEFMFYHHPDSPLIQQWRARFLRELESARPYFIVRSTSWFHPMPYGPASTSEFRELDAFIASRYEAPEDVCGSFRVWRRRSAPVSPR